MNSQHQIDRAEFDTTYADALVTGDQQARLDEFIQSDLLRIIDEVFDDIDRKSNNPAAVLCLERLEIDLGEISYRDYRQQMPQRLRRQLWQALDNARYTTAARYSTPSAHAGESGEASALAHYLRYGYLPWYASAVDADTLEASLLRVIETNPASLVEFIGSGVRKDDIIARLNAQFSTALVKRVMQLLESPDAIALSAGDDEPEMPQGQPAAQRDPQADTSSGFARLRAQLLDALSANGQAEFDKLWLGLVRDDPATLVQVLRDLGQQAVQRQRLLRHLSTQRFAELLRLLEPVAHDLLLSVLEPGHWLATLAVGSPAGLTMNVNQLRGFLLGYLLVERGARFDREDFIESLLGQIAASGSWSRAEIWPTLSGLLETPAQADGISGELARLMLAQVERMASPAAMGWVDAYRSYARIEAMFSPPPARPSDALLLADIDALERHTPWLLLRLLRELQHGGDDWQAGLSEFSAPLLKRLVFVFLSLINQTVASETSTGTAQLVAAIRRNVAHAGSPRAYYAGILGSVIKAGVIDFEAICGIETGGIETGRIETGGDDPDYAAGIESVEDASQDAAADTIGDAVKQTAAVDAGGEPAIARKEKSETAGLSEPERHDAIGALSPMGERAARLVQLAELLTTASLAAGLALPVPRLHAIKWRFIETYASETGQLLNRDQFLRRYLELLREQAGVSNAREFYSLLGQSLLQNGLPATRDLTRQIIELLDDLAAELAPVAGVSDADSTPADSASPEMAFDEIAADEDIHIANAGLVLLAPWLPRLFEQLGYLEAGEFKDLDTAERAIHCLQFLVDASVASPEYQLVLNKLLCGVKPGKPIRRRIELTTFETEQLESLLTAVTGHWRALENTSIDGLRESFLQRGGRLRRKGDAWQLAVEARAFDMLLDQVPWSYSTIKFGWMERVIYVDWR